MLHLVLGLHAAHVQQVADLLVVDLRVCERAQGRYHMPVDDGFGQGLGLNNTKPRKQTYSCNRQPSRTKRRLKQESTRREKALVGAGEKRGSEKAWSQKQKAQAKHTCEAAGQSTAVTSTNDAVQLSSQPCARISSPRAKICSTARGMMPRLGSFCGREGTRDERVNIAAETGSRRVQCIPLPSSVNEGGRAGCGCGS